MRIRFTIAAFLIFIFPLFLPLKVYADNPNNFGDYAIASSIKTMAKAYVQTADLEKLKAKHLKSLSRMTELRFHRHYAQIYNFLKGIPLSVREEYGLKQDMTKEEALKEIRRVDKNDLFSIINVIPDEVIVKAVRNYLHQAYKSDSQNAFEQINSLWKKILQKA